MLENIISTLLIHSPFQSAACSAVLTVTNYCTLVFDYPTLDLGAYSQCTALPLQAVMPDVHTAVAFPLSAPQQFVASFQS